jgi:hypothetical protein
MVFSANISILSIAKTPSPSLDIRQELSFLHHDDGVWLLSVALPAVPVPSLDTPYYLLFACFASLLLSL